MDKAQIVKYLAHFKGTNLNSKYLERLSELKKSAVEQDNQQQAKEIWCLEQVYKVISQYLNAFKKLNSKDYFDAWLALDRADTELYFLRKHFDYSDNRFNLKFIERRIQQLQKLFPYKHFFSREATIKKWTCSICNKVISLRNSCGHKVGEIYNGEQCNRIAQDIKFHGVALVTTPFDKYGVVFLDGIEYNYSILENLMKVFTDPYDKWEFRIIKKVNDEFSQLRRNDDCICASGKKYKHCCMKTGDDMHDHYQFLFEDTKKLKSITQNKPASN